MSAISSCTINSGVLNSSTNSKSKQIKVLTENGSGSVISSETGFAHTGSIKSYQHKAAAESTNVKNCLPIVNNELRVLDCDVSYVPYYKATTPLQVSQEQEDRGRSKHTAATSSVESESSQQLCSSTKSKNFQSIKVDSERRSISGEYPLTFHGGW